MPFNEAFLAPGQYHLFGCVPKLPNPLAPLFDSLNKPGSLGDGLPILSYPTIPTAILPPFALLGAPSPGGAGGIFGTIPEA